MRKFLTNIATVLLAFLVLFSSFSFTVEKHLCGGQLYSKSFFGHAKECGMEVMNNNDCSFSTHNKSVSKNSCCKTEFDFISGSQFKKEVSTSIASKQQFIYSSFIDLNAGLFLDKEFEIPFYKNYFPPPISKNLTILYRVFRI
jgi:hypothetical protein